MSCPPCADPTTHALARQTALGYRMFRCSTCGRGFGTFASAARFCTAHAELRDYLRPRTRMGEVVPLGEQRRCFRARWTALLTELAA